MKSTKKWNPVKYLLGIIHPLFALWFVVSCFFKKPTAKKMKNKDKQFNKKQNEKKRPEII